MYTAPMSDMHIIQKHIMRRLSENTCLRYADIQPEGVEGNQFSYHLRSLEKQSFIKRCKDGYQLTPKGMVFTGSVSFETFQPRIQPKIVTLVVCKNPEGKYLVYKRNRQPFIGAYGFPYGKIHMGERIEQAAKRELGEKTGVTAKLVKKGVMYLLVKNRDGETIAHTLFHIFLGSDIAGDPLSRTEYGNIHLKTEKELLTESPMPGVPEVLKIAKSKAPGIIFEEHEVVAA